MTEVVDSATLLGDLREARDAMLSASAWSKSAAVDKPRAAIANENAYAHAFVRAKEEKCTDSLAKQKALIETAVERQKYLELTEELMVAKAELHCWGELFAAYRSISYLTVQERKEEDRFDG